MTEARSRWRVASRPLARMPLAPSRACSHIARLTAPQVPDADKDAQGVLRDVARLNMTETVGLRVVPSMDLAAFLMRRFHVDDFVVH